MKHLIRYDSRFYPNGSKTKLYLSTIRQLNNAVDILRVEFEALPSGYVPFLNVQRYAKDKSYIDSTPQYIAFNEVDGGYEKVLTEWFTEIAGHIDVSVTLIGPEIEVEGELTNERIECGMFYISIDGVVISQGDSLPPPPPISEIEFKVDKDLTEYEVITEIARNVEDEILAFAYVDNGGSAEKIKLDNGEVLTELELMTKGYTKSLLDLKAEKSSAALSIKGNDTSSVGDVKDLTVGEVIDLLSPNGTMTINHNLRVMKDLFVDGEGYETKLQELKIEKNTLLLRDGALTGLAAGEYAGLIFHLYDGLTNGFFGVDKDGYAKVGDIGDLQTLATRQDTPIANGLAYWNDTLKRFDTDVLVTVATLRDHSLLTNRTQADQHSIGSITDLTTQLAAKAPLISPTFTNNAIGDVPLIVNAMVGTTNVLQSWRVAGVNLAHIHQTGRIYSAEGLAHTGGVSNSLIETKVNGTVISRNIADTNPALRVNLVHASATGNIAEFQKAGVTQLAIGNGGELKTANIQNLANTNNSSIQLWSSGLSFIRNINDANPLATFNNQQGTGNIANFQFGGVNKLEVTKDGWLFQNGVRLLHTFSHPTGSTAIPTGQNVFLGQEAGNLTMGSTATSTSDASFNVGVGYRALFSNTTGSYNTANGYAALYSNTTGVNNAANGMFALRSNTTGGNNTANGRGAGRYFGSGTSELTTINNSIFIGANSRAAANNDTNEIVIGYEALGKGSNTAVIGNTSLTDVYLGGNGTAKLHAGYDNTTSGLTATTIKGAIDELANALDGVEALLAAL